MTPYDFGRPVSRYSALESFVDEGSRLRAFLPPFAFTSFFSPEDTLLCVCAAEAALSRARSLKSASGESPEPLRIAELTSGSGLVGLHLLRIEKGSALMGLDVDPDGTETATRNARVLGLSAHASFETADLWSTNATSLLASWSPHLLVCNPPYIPEPPRVKLKIEAGSGPNGTAHLLRTLEIANTLRPRTMALSWCSLSDPCRVLRQAAAIGYQLNSLFVVAIADGEYSRSVHEYLRGLPYAFISEDELTVAAVAPDGSAAFAYLLMAGDFSRHERHDADDDGVEKSVRDLCENFSRIGIDALSRPVAPIPVRRWILDRWDELRLRAFLHGPIERMAETTA